MHFLQDGFPKSLPKKGMSDFTADYGLLTGLSTECSIQKTKIKVKVFVLPKLFRDREKLTF